jgi:hypothetical protein
MLTMPSGVHIITLVRRYSDSVKVSIMATKTHRTTITLPHDLKKRMDAANEQVNWSATAAAAFEAKLLEIESRKDVKDMSEVVERLRASKAKQNKADAEYGAKLGEQWAKKTAEYSQLKRLEQRMHSKRFSARKNAFYEDAFELYRVIHPEPENQDPTIGLTWWEEMVSGELYILTPAFLQAFVEAAVAVLQEVEGEL